MNWLDYILVFIFLHNLYNGFKTGFLRQISGLTSLLLSFYAALLWYGLAKTCLQNILKLDKIIFALAQNGEAPAWLSGIILNVIAFLLVFLLVNALLKMISRKLKFFNKIPLIGPLNALTGGVIGILKGMIVVFITVTLLSLIKTSFWSNAIDASAIVALSRHYLPLLSGLIFDLISEKVGQFS